MADQEKVIKGLECCIKHDEDFKHNSCSSLDCPYLNDCAFKNYFVKTSLIRDALELLKENEVHNYGEIITVYGHDNFEDAELYRDICETLKDAGLLTIHRTENAIGYTLGWKLMGVKKP